MWIFDSVVPVRWLERTPTYKEKRDEGIDNSMGLLNYPVLQAADIVIYKASRVPVGKDQAAHSSLREIARAFNRRYGEIFPEPQAVFTDAPVVLGTDGARKMSKSAGNTIPIFAEPEEIRKIVMNMVTDPLRIKRTDPGRPEVCNVCQLHRFFGSDYLQIQDGSAPLGRAASIPRRSWRIGSSSSSGRCARSGWSWPPIRTSWSVSWPRARPRCDRSWRPPWPRCAQPSAPGQAEAEADDGPGPPGRPWSPRATVVARLPDPGVGLLRVLLLQMAFVFLAGSARSS